MKNGVAAWFTALMLLVAVGPASSWTCPGECNCGRGPGYAFAQCPDNKPTVAIYNYIGRYMQITCNRQMKDLEFPWNFNMGPVPPVIFKKCPLPQTNYSTILKSLGAQGFRRLDICDRNLSASDLQSRLFGLDNVTFLSLNYLGLTDIPEDFLQSMPQITNLDLRYNRVQLPLGLFDYLPNLKILELSSNSLSHLEPGLFRNLSQLHRLNAWSNRLQNLTRETFMGLNNLEELDLNSNGIQEFSDDVFAELHSLKKLALEANNFTHLPSSLFRNTSMLEMVRINDNRRELASLPPGFLANLTHLREVYLHRMFLSQLPEDLFHGSKNLINITLFGNNLRVLPPGLFRDNVHLLRLDLSRNKLEHLPDDIFSTVVELQNLNLSNNRLRIINQYLFSNTNNLKTLSLRQNSITEIDNTAFFNLQKLQTFDISSNNVSFSNLFSMGYSSPLTNCKDLEYLNLSNNSITNIFQDWRNVMVQLKSINLSYNRLTAIEVQDLMFLAGHVRLDLTHNKIFTINLHGAEAIARNSIGSGGGAAINTTVYLEGNPLHCDCAVYDFLRYLEYKLAPEVHSRFELVPGRLTCIAPPMYEGMWVSSLRSEHFLCGCEDEQLQTKLGCPRNCTCCAKLHYGALIVDCSNAGLLHAPEELPHNATLLPHTQLLLQGNLITTLPKATQPGYGKVTFIDASHNRLNTLNVDQLPQKLETLNLHNNQLTHLDKPVLVFLTNRTAIKLHSNPWSCSCKNLDFLSFLQSQFKQVLDLSNITCTQQNGTSVPLIRMTADDICPTDVALIVTLGVTIGVVGLLLGATAMLYYRYQREIKVWLYAHNMLLWWVTEDELDKDKLYDAFVSFSHKDEDFVVNNLVPGLEGGSQPFKLCLHFRDWIAGEFIPQQIARSVNESRRTLVVLSPNFLESIWGRMEFRAAHQQALNEGRARVILILYGDIGPTGGLDPELKAYLSVNTYVKWGDPWFWDKLRYALPHRSQVKENHYHLNTAMISDKTDLMFPTLNNPTATTPPADTINPMFIIEDKAAAEKVAKLNGQLVFTDTPNGYIKCV